MSYDSLEFFNLYFLAGIQLVVSLLAALMGIMIYGLMALRSSGITVQMRKYIRDDRKTIELFPMAHVADANFYRQVSHAFPTNSIILMEGVTDKNHLLTNPISYGRMARSLGLAEQREKYTPGGGKGGRADVDISSFSTNTLNLLNLITLIHNKGLNPDTILKVLLYPQSSALEADLYDDLLKNRNQHLFDELKIRLTQTDCIVIPWGVAHMPGIAREIQKEGFHPDETNEYMVIRFHGRNVK